MSTLKEFCMSMACLMLASTAQAATRDDFLYGNANDGSNLPFRYFVPPGYDGAQQYPLILFLHGAGERGNDNEAQLNNNANGAMRLLDDANLALQPVFMIAPQCPTDGWWSGGTLTSAIHLVDQLSATYNIDPERIYVTGLSMGGMGTWSAVTAQPDRFAAAVPMSGNGDTNPAGAVSAIPFWFFHAANDGTVGVEGSDNLVAALRNSSGNVIYTRYDTGGHGIWPVAYVHPLLFQWLVSQQRGAPSAITPPILRIESPTDQPGWTTQDTTIDLAGSANHDTDAIESVAWDLLGGSGGAASGTASWSVGGIPLNNGANLVHVTATAPSLHDEYGGHTTFNDSLRVSVMGPPPVPARSSRRSTPAAMPIRRQTTRRTRPTTRSTAAVRRFPMSISATRTTMRCTTTGASATSRTTCRCIPACTRSSCTSRIRTTAHRASVFSTSRSKAQRCFPISTSSRRRVRTSRCYALSMSTLPTACSISRSATAASATRGWMRFA